MKKIVVSVFAFVFCFIIGLSSSFAHVIQNSGGFSPVSTDIHCLSSLMNEIKLAISSACSQWNAAGCGSLVFRGNDQSDVTVFPYDNDRNDITKGDRGSTYLMYTIRTYYSSGGKSYIHEADTDINTSFQWGNDGASNHYDIQNCMTHELGHLLGLGDDYVFEESTMYYGSTIGETKKRSLELDDKNGLNVIY